MERDVVALLGFVLMLVLMVLRVPIGIAMGVVGVLGFGMLSTWTAAFNLLANVPLSVVTDYDLADTNVYSHGCICVQRRNEQRTFHGWKSVVWPPQRWSGIGVYRLLRRLCRHQWFVCSYCCNHVSSGIA